MTDREPARRCTVATTPFSYFLGPTFFKNNRFPCCRPRHRVELDPPARSLLRQHAHDQHSCPATPRRPKMCRHRPRRPHTRLQKQMRPRAWQSRLPLCHPRSSNGLDSHAALMVHTCFQTRSCSVKRSIRNAEIRQRPKSSSRRSATPGLIPRACELPSSPLALRQRQAAARRPRRCLATAASRTAW